MPEKAQVTSIEALESFRAGLIVYLSKMRPVLEDACDDVFRTRVWLQHDQRLHWEHEVRRRGKKLEEAEQALFSARLGNLREPTMAEHAAVQRAKRALTEAEEKLKRVKRWSTEFDHRVEPLVKQLEHLRTLLASDMPKAVAHLAQIIKLLDEYAGISPSVSISDSAPASETPASKPAGGESDGTPDVSSSDSGVSAATSQENR